MVRTNRPQQQRLDKTRALLNVFIFCLLIAGLWFVCLNVSPYIKFVTILSQGVFKFDSNLASLSILLIFGTCFWAILQFLQLFPILLFSSEKFMKSLITKSDTRQKVNIRDGDEAVVVKMKTVYNALPVSFVANLEKLCVVSYLIDFMVNSIINSPIKGGIEMIGDMLLYGRFELINWGNVFLNLQTIFAVEFIVLMLIWTFSLLSATQPQR
ncbi:MAG: hypothetical protein KME60_13470 [Cyanomargarita calcarea GSE-NOS-MK-12-04C]|jgi:hypothetical protein|uniref:Uncharacterized protein n=1 Tax=Cyanomargarita calcarea GSE-NOS-MK-12-04C TaxID=2839659 RepID=A0A951US67_9CYAN|nr:hypothetical protein [Cyanomargarita calcarea GSE-NOS-MK-12-04C]